MKKKAAITIALPLVATIMLFDLSATCAGEEPEALHWSADFEQGAASDVHLREDGAIGFSIPPDPGGDEYLWFCLYVVTEGRKGLEFVLENAAGAHQTGHRWNITRPVFSTDGRNWIRAAETSYAKDAGLARLFGQPVFRFRSPLAADTLWVAYSYPYTLSDLQLFLNRIKDRPDVAISTLGKSEEGRDILKVEIEGRADSAAEPLRRIWIVGREHPGETPLSFVCEGMIQALLDHPAGRRMRDAYGFSIIPILNVDGVAHGYYYHNAQGVNLARDWADFRSAEVRLVRDALAQDAGGNALRLVINLHSSNDPDKGHFFLRMAEDKLRPADAEFQRAIFQAADKNHPQMQGCSPVTLYDLPGITGNALYRDFGVYCLYLESNYSRGADGTTVTPESLHDTGAALVQALAEVLRPE